MKEYVKLVDEGLTETKYLSNLKLLSLPEGSN